MNIFVTSTNPKECAEFLDDKRCIKMLLETAQMLSTVVRSYDNDFADRYNLYKSTHANHPCNVWAKESIVNFTWLTRHMFYLGQSYTKRYNKVHKSMTLLPAFIKFINDNASYTDKIKEPTAFVNCAANKEHGVDFKHFTNTTLAYQLYLNARWDTDKRQPTWKGMRHG